MNQTERIRHMEAIMKQAEAVLPALREALEQYRVLEEPLEELEEYYTSPLWRRDLQDDADGKLPPELERGILSEDGLWNLLADRDALLHQMREMTAGSIEEA